MTWCSDVSTTETGTKDFRYSMKNKNQIQIIIDKMRLNLTLIRIYTSNYETSPIIICNIHSLFRSNLILSILDARKCHKTRDTTISHRLPLIVEFGRKFVTFKWLICEGSITMSYCPLARLASRRSAGNYHLAVYHSRLGWSPCWGFRNALPLPSVDSFHLNCTCEKFTHEKVLP